MDFGCPKPRVAANTEPVVAPSSELATAAPIINAVSEHPSGGPGIDSTFECIYANRRLSSPDCEKDGKTYANGDKLVAPDTPCTVCYCKGECAQLQLAAHYGALWAFAFVILEFWIY